MRPNLGLYHVAIDSHVNDFHANKWLLGIAPHAGVNIKMSDHVTVRASAGLNFAQSKTIFQNYTYPELVASDGISAKYAFKPCNANFKLGVIYNF